MGTVDQRVLTERHRMGEGCPEIGIYIYLWEDIV